MRIDKVNNFFFHPLSEKHSKVAKTISVITVVALSILTGFIFLWFFTCINLRDRQINAIQPNKKALKNVQDLNKVGKIAPAEAKFKPANPTAEILNDINGFSIAPEENEAHPFIGHIGPVQGHVKFRAKVAKMTLNDSSPLNPKAIRENREVNPSLSLILTGKRLAHALSFRGEMILDNDIFNLEGFNEVFTIPMLADSFNVFAKENPLLITQDRADWVLQHFTKTSRGDALTADDIVAQQKNLKNPYFEGPECVSTGYDWHGTFLVFFRYFVFSMNRGIDPFQLKLEGEDVHVHDLSGSGVSVFTAEKPFDISDEVAAKIFKRISVSRHTGLNINDLQKELGLQFLDIKRTKNQKVGNCTYVNTKLAIWVLLALYSIKDYEKIITPDLDTAFENARKIYKQWSDFDRNYVVKDLVEELQNLQAKKQKGLIYDKLFELLKKARQKRHKLSLPVQEDIDKVVAAHDLAK